MVKNYLKMAYRNLMRHKVFSLLNISGLALGMTCSILIMLWVQDELSFDRFHENSDRLYQVVESQSYPGANNFETVATPGLLAEAMKQELPEIEHAVRVTWPSENLLTNGEKSLKAEGSYVDDAFFKLFSFQLLQGDSKQVLQHPNSIIISNELATKLFGTTEVIGKIVKLNNEESFHISGIVNKVPKNSTITFDYVIPFKNYFNKSENDWLKVWGNNNVLTFLLLKPNIDIDAFNSKIKLFIKDRHKVSNVELFLHAVSDLHLYSYHKSADKSGLILYVRIFTIVAIFLLAIACINFMNLATARSAKRAKEVGVRKAIGANRSSLVSQFMIESTLVAFIALFLALNLTGIILPYFNDLTSKEMVLDFADPVLMLMLLGVALFTGLVSGSYPAFFLSSFDPVLVLKGTIKLNKGVATFRKGLVVFQFALSALLIVVTLVVSLQLHFIRNTNIGLDRENVIYIPLEGNLKSKYNLMKRDLLSLPGVMAVSSTNQNPLSVGNNTGDIEWKGKEADANILVDVLGVDYDFLELMDIKLKEGRFFSKEFKTDTAAFILNEAAVKQMGLKEPVGQWLKVWETGHIIGVIKDFHSNSFHRSVKPMVLCVRPQYSNLMLVRIASGQTENTLSAIEEITKQHNPAFPFQYHFLDDMYERMYKREVVMSKLTTSFATIAILISCLGLFGLALFTAEQRTKEIGVRKVLGASVVNIVFMLSKDFLKLVVLANLIALPLSWYLMKSWLSEYAYRTELSWWIFATALIATVIIAMFTLSYHAVKTAIINPINSLRTE